MNNYNEGGLYQNAPWYDPEHIIDNSTSVELMAWCCQGFAWDNDNILTPYSDTKL